MTDIRRIGDSGIHTVEGNVAGSRAARLTNERQKQKDEYEKIKTKIKDDLDGGIGII
jgi:protein FAM50